MKTPQTIISKEKHGVLRIPDGKHYKLGIVDLEQCEIVEIFTPGLKVQTANRWGKELSDSLGIKYFYRYRKQMAVLARRKRRALEKS